MQNELELLENVELRWALSETSKQLEESVDRFLCPVLLKLASPHESVRAKVMQMLSNINVRIKSDQVLRLPVSAIFEQLLSPQVQAIVKNFTIIYLDMGYSRLPLEEKLVLLPKLLTNISLKPLAHQTIILHMVLPILGFVRIPDKVEEMKEKFPFAENPKDTSIILSFLLDTLLFSAKSSGAPVGLAQPIKANEDLPFGLSHSNIVQQTNNGKKTWTFDDLSNAKYGILTFLYTDLFPPNKKLPHFIVASCASSHELVDKGEGGLKRFKFNLEDPILVQELYALYQGGVMEKDANLKKKEASLAVKGRILIHLQKSVKATNVFPSFLQVIFDCLYGQNTTKKLKQTGMGFAHWVCRMADQQALAPVAPVLLSGLLKLLTEEGPSQDMVDENIRGFNFVAVSTLCKRVPKLVHDDFSILELFFKSLVRESATVKISVQEGLSTLMTVLKDLSAVNSKKLENLLVLYMTKEEYQCRLIAVKYAIGIFPFTHPGARYICLLGSADHHMEVREHAKEGLLFPSQRARIASSMSTHGPEVPPFPELVAYIYQQISRRQTDEDFSSELLKNNIVLTFTQECLYQIVRFLRLTLLVNADPELLLDPLGEVLDPVLPAKVSNLLSKHWHPESDHNPVSQYAKLLEKSLDHLLAPHLVQMASEALFEVLNCGPTEIALGFLPKLPTLQSLESSPKEPIRDSVAHIVGVVVVKASEPARSQLLQQYMTSCTAVAQDEKRTIDQRQSAILILGYLVSEFLSHQQALPDTALPTTITTLRSFVASGVNNALSSAACHSLGAIGRNTSLEAHSSSNIAASILALIKKTSDPKLIETGVLSLAHIAVGDRSVSLHEKILLGLCEYATKKNADLHFTIGEAISCLIGGWSSRALLKFARTYTPAPMEIDSENKTLALALPKILSDYANPLRPDYAQASCIWMLSIAKFNGNEPSLKSFLPVLHDTFTKFLSDRDEFTQECASKGIGLIFEMGDPGTRSNLVFNLVSTFTTQTASTVKVNEGTQIFEDEIGSTPTGNSVTTYKELCSLASEMNQPDLVYKFMSLANHSSMWNTKKGAAFGFSSIVAKAGDQLKPFLPSLIPKLYRYQRDPNPKIRESMAAIWKVIVEDPQKTVQEFFAEIIKDLLASMGNRVWRTRESGALALSDLLSGRQLSEVEEYLEQSWFMSTRVLDDIKESVRLAGFACCKTLSTLTIKLCDPSGNLESGAKAMKIMVPFLLHRGITSDAEEVRVVMLDLLFKITRQSGVLLKPYVAEIIHTLLESLSSMEPQVLNYLAFHVEKSGLSQEQFENTRLAATKNSPMMTSIEACLDQIDASLMEEVIPNVLQVIRKGVGLPTRAGCARVVSTLAYKLPAEIKPHAPALIKALSGAIQDKSPVVAKLMATSMARLVALAPDATLTKLVAHLQKIYLETEDAELRGISGITMLEISRQAVDVLKRCASDASPLIFFGMHDEDEATQKIWSETWEDITQGLASGLRLHLPEIVTFLLKVMDMPSWNMRKQAAVSLSTAATALEKNTEARESFYPLATDTLVKLMGLLAGRTWKGKETVLQALCNVCMCAKPLFAQEDYNGPTTAALLEIFLREAGKKDKNYLRISLECLGKFVNTFGLNAIDQTFPIYMEVIKPTGGNDSGDEESETGRRPLQVLVLASAYRGLGLTWPKAAVPEKKLFDDISGLINAHMFENPWNVQVAMLDGLGSIFNGIRSSQGAETLLSVAVVTEQLEVIFRSLSEAKYPAVRAASLKCVKELVYAVRDSPLWVPEIKAQVESGIEASLSDTVGETADYANQVKILLN